MAQRFMPPFGTAGTGKKPAQKSTPQERGAGALQGAEQQEPEQVAAEHGPAVEVHLQHEHEMGSHHVHSIHADGHEHHSDHASAEEAHEHAKKLATADGAEHDSGEDDDWEE